MGKRRLVLLIGIPVAVLAVVGLVMLLAPEREPEYGGIKLSEWVEKYGAGHRSRDRVGGIEKTQNANAIRHFGTNAVPYLLKWIRFEPSPWKTKCRSAMAQFTPKSMDDVIPDLFSEDLKELRADGAGAAFAVLGEQAEGGIGELSKLLNDPTAPQTAYRAACALGYLGTRGLPPLVAALTNHQPGVRVYAASGFRLMGTNGRPALPALIECLGDKDEVVALTAANTLCSLKEGSRLVTARLTNSLRDPRLEVRLQAVSLLGRLGEEARDALPALLALRKASNGLMRASATVAIRHIDPGALEDATH